MSMSVYTYSLHMHIYKPVEYVKALTFKYSNYCVYLFLRTINTVEGNIKARLKNATYRCPHIYMHECVSVSMC